MRQPALPLPPPLRGADPDSFARDTVLRRLPAIAGRVLTENRLDHQAARAVAGLAAEIPFTPLRPLADDAAPDLALWRSYLAPYAGQDWLAVPWFLAETYFYRRILEAIGYFRPRSGAYGRDPYARQKRLGLEHTSLAGLSDEPLPLDAALRGALWGNQADLSLWPADAGDGPGGATLLADDGPAVLAHLDALIARSATVDVVLDNAGAELVHDLLLADALLARGLRVRLHPKAHPTFVSDATAGDARDTVAWLAERPGPVARAAERLIAALATSRLTLHDDWFWTSPLAGWEMPETLFDFLATSGLLISKGDANYRRWLGDRHWPADTPLEAVLGYAPAPLLLLRTCKSEVAIGLDQARVAAARARDPQWMINGRWGLAQFVAIAP
jgi:hypothetical protein